MKRRMICILICLTILTSTQVFAVPESASMTENLGEAEIVETIALDYITQYVYNSYLYEDNDLYKGTICEAIDENVITQTGTAQFSVAGEMITADTLNNRVESFRLAADYYRHIRTAQEIERFDFKYDPTVIDSVVTGDSATVHIYTNITFKYERDGEEAACGDNYMVYLLKRQDQWMIADVQAEALVAFGLTGLKDTYTERITAFDEMLASGDVLTTEAIDPLVSTQAALTTYDRAYHVNNSIAYAYTYTTSSYNNVSGTGNNSAYMNCPPFTNYTNRGGNCQNFVSQCLWAGLGGNETNEALEYISGQGTNHHFPMNNSWYEILNDGGHSPSWTFVDSFHEYAKNSSGEMIATYCYANGSFSQIPLSYLRGSVLDVNPNSDGYAHAVLITKASGSSFADVEICGNSPMRKAVSLNDELGDNRQVRLIVPTGMKNGRSCGNSTHSFTGSHCKCNYCEFNKLTVIGTRLKPVPVGSTQTITASANAGCYRMAMCIKYDADGASESWTEYMNTSQVSRSFTFTRTGLYTITVVGRDVSPSDANSVTSTHVFKIRVY